MPKWNLDNQQTSTDADDNGSDPSTTYFKFNSADHPETVDLLEDGGPIREHMSRFPVGANEFGADLVTTFAPVALPERYNDLSEFTDLSDRSTINAKAIKWVLDEAGELDDETADALIEVINASRADTDDEGDDN